MSRERFAGLNILVVGGTSDIGAACAVIARAEGGRVMATSRNPRGDGDVVQQASFNAPHVIDLDLDLADAADIAAFPDRLRTHATHLDVLIIASGRTAVDTATAADSFDSLMSVNAKGPYLLIEALRPLMRRGGSVICVSSAVARRRGVGMTAYAASKAALEAIVRTLGLEFTVDGVRVNAVAPGPTATSGLMRPLHDDDDPQLRAARIASSLPLGRLGQPSEVAHTVMFLASAEASNINALTVLVDGGWDAA
ncbi:SDR family NAD(P)-dependent oxidoreductase [Microbacterium maritypicum]|uniref:SDR family NAD(P)-dependent oxidoreductase n=1 Tax=Microbacterium TaxID=33882 RepID=UPI0025FFB848|nr:MULTISPECIES: SDR family oxidoreductase [Microbacterium]